MEESDDFNYDSVVSDAGAYSGIINAGEPGRTSVSEDKAGLGNTILTPSTHAPTRAEYAPASAPTDSMPSLAVSSPTSEGFQLEYEREMRDHGHYDSQQSQFGLKSGMYVNGSETDISAKLKGDVVFEGKWSAVGDSIRRTHGRQGSHSAIDDTTFDIPSFNDSTDVTLSRLIHESSDDDQRRAVLQSQYASGSEQPLVGRHPPSAPTTPVMKQSTVDVMVTPKMTRALSDGSVLHSAPGEERVLRSALRGSRSTGPPLGKVQFDEASLGSLHKVSTASGMDGVSAESIEFGPPAQQEDKNDMDTQPLNADSNTEATGASNEPGDEYQNGPPAAEQATSPRLGSLEGITGAGMAGGMFRKFAGWTRNHLTQRPSSPAPAAASINPANPGSRSDNPDPAIESSSQSASTVSPVRTEPMHSQLLSNFTTPTSSRSATSETTPRQRPASAKKNGHTPSRSVNPLTRHLALKAIRSAPPAQRSMLKGGEANEASPTSRGLNDTRPLIDSMDASEDSAMLGLAELQQQFDGFASRLKHDASAVHADVLESEEAWAALQNELQTAQMQLLQAETARDFLQQRVEGADRDRVDWEQERLQMQNEKEELQESVDQWRKRIGDAEKERQGMWSEDMQTREQLLETIAHLEERARENARRWNADRADMASEIDALLADYDKLASEKERIVDDYVRIESDYDQLDSENRQMQSELERMESENQQLQADMHDLHTGSKGELAATLANYAELERERNELRSKVARQDQERDELRSKITKQEQDRDELNAKIAKQDSDMTLLRETLEVLTERNHELKNSRDESNFFTTAINETMLPPSPETDPAENKPESDRDSTVVVLEQNVAELKQKLKQMVNDNGKLVESLQNTVEDMREYKKMAAELQEKLKQTPTSSDTELEQLREIEELLKRELDRSEAAREAAEERLKAQEERARALGVRNDEQAQRIARLEIELGDLQMREGDADNLQQTNGILETMVADLEQQLQREQAEGEDLRLRVEAADATKDELARARENVAMLEASNKQLTSEITGLQAQAVGKDESKADRDGPKPVQGASESAGTSISPELERRELEAGVAALEESLDELRRRRTLLEKEKRLLADGLRDVLNNNRTLRNELARILLGRMGKLRELQGLQRSESHGSDGDASMMSGLLNQVPSMSQLMDDNSKYLNSLDRHLKDVDNIIEDDEPQQAPIKRTTAAHVFAERTQKRLLTPIREETVSRGRMLQDATTQCSQDSVEDEQRAQRAALAGVEQERDQFRAAHEEATEHVTRLAGQIEELSEDHERMRAERTTLARSALCVGRQLEVLRGALSRLAARDSSAEDTAADADDVEDARAMEEDDAMLSATFERPLGEDEPQASDEALENIGLAVSKAYSQLKQVRRDVVRARRERARLMKRLAEFERTKLPSYELSSQWGRRVRARSVADGTEPLLADDDDAEPPASLFLPDESAVLAELAASKAQPNGDVSVMASFVSPDALRDPTAAARELARLAALVTNKDRRLRAADASLQKIEELNRDLVAKLDRAYAERIRAQQDAGTAALRASARSASRANTPNRGTDWDDLDSIVRELERCKDKNTAYFGNVERLCAVLNRHTLDRALSDDDDSDVATRRQSSAPPENTYRKLLVDMATALDAMDDLDARKSIRDNFTDMAAAVRRRLDAADAELRQTRSALDVSRLASEASPDAMQRARAAERRAGELETQLAEQHAQQANDQATLRSLNSTISRLRQQCVSAEADVQEARMERDGWNQQFVGIERTLQYQMARNEQLEKELRDLGRQRSRDTQEFVLSHGDHTASINWDHITQEVTARVHRDAEARWNAREFALSQAYESQVKVFRWASRMWSSVVRTIAAHYMRDLPKSVSTEAEGRCDSLCRAVDDLESQVDAAAKSAAALQNGLDGTRSRNEFVEMLAQIFNELEQEFTSSWRDNVRNCIMTLAASAGMCASAKTSPSGSATSSGSSGDPKMTAKQKQMVREHMNKRETRIREKYDSELQAQREKSKQAAAKLAKVEGTCKSLMAERQYLRMRTTSETERARFVHYQKEFLVRVIGGPTGMFRLVDAMPELETNQYMLRREQIRRRWRRVLLAVHMKNQLIAMVAKTQQANDIKEKELVRMGSINGRDKAPKPKPVDIQPVYDDPPVFQNLAENTKLPARGGVFYNYRFQPQQFVGLKSTPITPSRLRNRTSDIASSTGSSI